jgi:hypothetical protein
MWIRALWEYFLTLFVLDLETKYVEGFNEQPLWQNNYCLQTHWLHLAVRDPLGSQINPVNKCVKQTV